mgnify:CR=1 FL=1
MNRENLQDAIFETIGDTHMATYALQAALSRLDLRQLGEVFDQVADHHSLRTDPAGSGRPSMERASKR